LIAVGSRHGATTEIAEFLRDRLLEAGFAPVVRRASEVDSLAGFNAVIVGSAVYRGEWLRSARELAEWVIAVSEGRPMWFFSSGPVTASDIEMPAIPSDIAPLLTAPNVHGHRRFGGKIDSNELGPVERIMRPSAAPSNGDFRDWYDVHQWAVELTDVLATLVGTPGHA